MRKSYLYTREQVRELTDIIGFDVKLAQGSRQSGRSTAIAFRVLADAMDNPGTRVIIEDHSNHKSANKHLTKMIQRILNCLEFKGFTFDPKHGSIEFNIFEPMTKAEKAIYY